jgi:hypothetical protein
MSKLLILTVAAALATALLVGPAAAAGTTGDTALASAPITGTTVGGGSFAGTMIIEGLVVQDGQLFAVGTVSGASFAAPAQVQQQQEGCSLLTLSIGAVDVSVAGLVSVHLDPIVLEVRLEGLVGSLVCGLLGGIAPAQ